MSFHPSPSIDCHTTPMEVQLPFIQEAMNEQMNSRNGEVKVDVANTPRPRRSSTAAKGCCNYHSSTGQYMFRCPPCRFSKQLISDELLCISQIATTAFYQALLSEFIGTMLLTLICTSTGLPIATESVPGLHGTLVAGFIIATVVVGFGHISGAHINPAVTLSFLVSCEIDVVRALCYIGMQLLGAISGSCLLKFLAPSHAQGNLGLNTITKGVSIPQAIVVECIITYILCNTVHAICDKKREDIGGSKALAVGLSIIVGCLFGGPYTGASMNPARSFGPAVVMNSWENHWVYWVGPLAGSVLAAVMYTCVLRQQPRIVVRSESLSRSRLFTRKGSII